MNIKAYLQNKVNTLLENNSSGSHHSSQATPEVTTWADIRHGVGGEGSDCLLAFPTDIKSPLFAGISIKPVESPPETISTKYAMASLHCCLALAFCLYAILEGRLNSVTLPFVHLLGR